MSCANTNWPEYMMGNSGEKIPVSQKIHVQVGDTPKHTVSYFRSNCYITVLAKLPDTTGLARKRFILGYPPRKQGDTSIGDAINWEWIVKCSIDSGKHIVIVTRDTDYGAIYEGKSYLNDWLRQEFSERVSKKRKIILTDRLSSGLKIVHAAVTKEMEEEEEKLLAELMAEFDDLMKTDA